MKNVHTERVERFLTLHERVSLALRRVRVAITGMTLDALQQVTCSQEAIASAIEDHELECLWLEREAEAVWHQAEARMEAEYRRTHSWLDLALDRMPGMDRKRRAEAAVQAMIGAQNEPDFAGASPVQRDLSKALWLDTYNVAMACLAALPDREARDVLRRHQARDLDGSWFRVATIPEVRRWQRRQIERGNVIGEADPLAA